MSRKNIAIRLSGNALHNYLAIKEDCLAHGLNIRDSQIFRSLAAIENREEELFTIVEIESKKKPCKEEKPKNYSVSFDPSLLEKFDAFFIKCRQRGLQNVFYYTYFCAVLQHITKGIEVRALIASRIKIERSEHIQRYHETWHGNRA